MNRRTWLQCALATIASGVLPAASAATRAVNADINALQKNWRLLLAQGVQVPSPAEKVQLSKEEWRKRLGREQFHVLREEGTERAGSSPLNDEKRAGVYVCAGCNLPLFTSEMKFDSGTGWPSFFTTIPGVFETKEDRVLFMARTEYHCTRCGGHHGHVFDDGPRPTGLRYCNNGLALKFIPKSAKA